MNIKTIVTAAAIVLAGSVTAQAATINGVVSVSGTALANGAGSTITHGDTANGKIDFNPETAVATQATGDFDALICDLGGGAACGALDMLTLTDLDFANLPSTLWALAPTVSFMVTAINKVIVEADGEVAIAATGMFIAAGFDDTIGHVSITSDGTGTQTVGFSSTAIAVPVPAAGFLLLGGLGGLAAMRRKQRRKAA